MIFRHTVANTDVEIGLGLGGGAVIAESLSTDWPTDRREFSYIRPSAQIGFGYAHDLIDVGFAVRVAHVLLVTPHGTLVPPFATGAGTFIEPMFFVRIGFEQIKLEHQLGFVRRIHSDDRPRPTAWPLRASLGLSFDFDLGGAQE